eukprot:235018-Prymnesium_polylepis.1
MCPSAVPDNMISEISEEFPKRTPSRFSADELRHAAEFSLSVTPQSGTVSRLSARTLARPAATDGGGMVFGLWQAAILSHSAYRA